MEYVVLGTASLAIIKRTHGRYLGGNYEVVKSMGSSCVGAWNQSSQQVPEESRGARVKASADALNAP